MTNRHWQYSVQLATEDAPHFLRLSPTAHLVPSSSGSSIDLWQFVSPQNKQTWSYLDPIYGPYQSSLWARRTEKDVEDQEQKEKEDKENNEYKEDKENKK